MYDAILEFTKASNLPDVLNSVEDAAVERVMSEMGKDENGSIAFTRNYIVEKDTQHKLDGINNDAIPLIQTTGIKPLWMELSLKPD